ncbi:MAG: T9SS type A sorting domain-containing protein [Bacteroidales bacterium]
MKIRHIVTGMFMLVSMAGVGAQDVFTLKPELVGQHPRILFTQEEADVHAIKAQQYMPEEWQLFVDDCLGHGYPTNTSILGQQQWWYFSRLGIGIAMTRDQRLIDKGDLWLSKAFNEEWALSSDKTVGLDVAHKLAGFALLYDCMYNYLSQDKRDDYEAFLETALVKFRTHGYDIGDYWTNDYQNNHMHFRATASLFASIILYDKFTSLQSEYDYIMTVWRRIGYMSPPDGSNHEGLNYSNYGGQMLYPGIYALKHCTDMDLTKSEHYHNVGYYYIHHLVPGMVSGFGFGDAGNSAASSGPNYLFQIARFTRDPHIQYTAHRLRAKYPDSFFLRQWFILFNDPLLEQKELTDLQPYRYFDDIGIVISRSGWGPDATAVAFKCGPLGGKLLNETRGTEYSWYTDYVNVAHDDPDQGTFLLFTRGSFLTTGDGYEKTNKTTLQHSTFIVDDRIQYGGGGTWCQPEQDQSRYAYPKDFFAVDNRVVFSGDMKGVYPDMEKLDRTFISQKAEYIIIYDDVRSETSGRTFEWRLQTEGNLSAAGEKTFEISKGNGSALARILAPMGADWSQTTNKIGNILRTRQTGQQANKYLVLLWPNAADLSAVKSTIDNASVLGVKIEHNGQHQYTLFQREAGNTAETGSIRFSGSTLLFHQAMTGQKLLSAMLVNGDSLIVDSVRYFAADQKVNFGIESISTDTSEIIYRLGASSSSVTGDSVRISLGGLTPFATYYLFKGAEAEGVEVNTDANGTGYVKTDLETISRFALTKRNVNVKPLSDLIIEAVELYNQAEEGTEPGQYPAAVMNEFALDIDSAEAVVSIATLQGEINDAVAELEAGMASFKQSVSVDKSILGNLVSESGILHGEAVEGEQEGEYAIGSKAVFKTAIDSAEAVLADTTVSQPEINEAVQELVQAMVRFKAGMVPIKPKTVFSDIEYYGDFLNYTVRDQTIWEVKQEGDNYIVGMHDISTTSGQFMLLKDSAFQHFELSFRARSVQGSYPNDIMIVFGHHREGHYSYVKLSSEINESGIFTRMGGPTVFKWVLDDYETYGVKDYDWNNYQLVSVDSVLTVYRNDEVLFSKGPKDSIYYEGGIGLGTYYRNRAYFDDVSVTRLASSVGSERNSAQLLRCYPNPAGEMLYIEPARGLSCIEIYNIFGKKIFMFNQPFSHPVRINLADFCQGVYILRATREDGLTGTYRFIKN